METIDILIIGGGVIGLSIPYHLARRGEQRVIMLERAAQVGTGATAKATGGIRHQLSTEINIRLTQLSLSAFQRLEQETGESVDLTQHGYLFLTTQVTSSSATSGVAVIPIPIAEATGASSQGTKDRLRTAVIEGLKKIEPSMKPTNR
jgi:glycine/D-amino acid oxidase-like deaminating enzyme